jgi:hypothetical protein
VEGWWWGLPYIGSGRRGRGGGAGSGRGKEEEAKRCSVPCRGGSTVQRRQRSGVQRKERPRVGRCWAKRLPWLGPTSGNSKENRDRLPRPPDRIERMNRKGP